MTKNRNEFDNYKIKLYKIDCKGYKTSKGIRVEIVDREITKLFILSNKKVQNNKKEDSVSFTNEKNPDLGGDFEIIIKIGKEKLGAWFNVSFIAQIAYLEKKGEKDEKGPPSAYEQLCSSGKFNYNHYKFLHVDEGIVKNDPSDTVLWERKIKRIEAEESYFEMFNKNM